MVIIDNKEGGETEVVAPSNWIDEMEAGEVPSGWKTSRRDGGATCLWWPRGAAKKMEKYHIKNRTDPCKNSWTYYQVIRVKMYGGKFQGRILINDFEIIH